MGPALSHLRDPLVTARSRGPAIDRRSHHVRLGIGKAAAELLERVLQPNTR